MKITASQRDDILKRKAEYEADKAYRQAKYNEQYKSWDAARDGLFESVKAEILRELGNVAIDLDVRVFTKFGANICVDVKSNENRVHAEDKALSWTWSAYLNKSGDVQKESSSWSGLNATTRAQLDSLKETLRVLEILNDLDWATLLTTANSSLPKYSDYVTIKDPSYESTPDWNAELQMVEIEDAIKHGTLLKGVGYKYYRGDCWYRIVRETPKNYDVIEVSDFYRRSDEEFKQMIETMSPYRISKDKFMEILDSPIVTLEV